MTIEYHDDSTYSKNPYEQAKIIKQCTFANGSELALIYNNGGDYEWDEEYHSELDDRLWVYGKNVETSEFLWDYSYSVVLITADDYVQVWSQKIFTDSGLTWMESFGEMLQLFQELHNVLSLE